MTESISDLLTKLKQEFFEWCSLISIDEACSNKKLILVIERIERMLIAAAA